MKKLQSRPVSGTSLAVFRILFGSMMFVSGIRFWMNGWINQFYITPQFHFTYLGFEWVKPLSEPWIYIVFSCMVVASLLVALGLFYRVAIILFFLLFSYFELIDKTLYLNHYYFVSLLSFLMIFLPANKAYSFDVLLGRVKPQKIPLFFVNLVRFQLCIVYFFAGVAKINYDWLILGQPMDIWLNKYAYLPLIGNLLNTKSLPVIMSWAGMLFDISIPLWVNIKSTRKYAYAAIVIFHGLTALLFPIGVFPFVMIISGLIFFPVNTFEKIPKSKPLYSHSSFKLYSPVKVIFTIFFLFQIIWPFRYLTYPGKLFWHEQGFRFSWRVMLMEKNGYTEFLVKEPDTGKQWEVNNQEYLTPLQEKMMSTQPDFILEFAKYLDEKYQKMGIANPEIYAYSWASLNGRSMARLIESKIDLTKQERGFKNKSWITDYDG